jgi:hypothetical protein
MPGRRKNKKDRNDILDLALNGHSIGLHHLMFVAQPDNQLN